MEFARLSIEGMPVSKRKITPLIQNGFVSGYDDIRLPTLRGLRKRGIVPEAIKNFVFSQGISKVESNASFSLVEAENRKVIDSISKRLFFVPDPVKLVVSDLPIKNVTIPFHPTDRSLGKRIIQINNTFYIPGEDIKSLEVGDLFRLKDLCNVRIESRNKEIHGIYKGMEIIDNSKKIQWTSTDALSMIINKPDLLFKNNEFNSDSMKTIVGYVEPTISNFKSGEIIQFERFGFVKIEKHTDSVYGFFIHR
jgi:glutamyl-tRNA synthetase